MVFSIVLAVLYEGLKSLREYLMCVGLQSSWHQAHTKKSPNQRESCSESSEPLMVNDTPSVPKKHKYVLIAESLLHIISFSMHTGN